MRTPDDIAIDALLAILAPLAFMFATAPRRVDRPDARRAGPDRHQDEAYRNGHRILLEGTQGTALSTFHGSYPHVTRRDTTAAGCLAEAGIAWSRVNRVIMVCRTYPIRVMSPADSTSGPMKQELTWDVIAQRSGVPLDQLERTEKGSVSHNPRRVSEFDWELLRSAAELNGATEIALTFADYFGCEEPGGAPLRSAAADDDLVH